MALHEPQPPRRLNRAIPQDLETIILKAMAREPEQRYDSAQEMADDLTSFLEHRPIRATRPTLRERLTKWAWRHRSMVSVAAGVLVLAVVGLAAQQDQDGEILNRFAWLLTTCPDRQIAAPTEAVGLAEKALCRKPNESRFQNTLGVALYRAGQLGPAITALDKSMQLSAGGSAYDWFFLAMAHHRSGAQEQGRVWYEKGLAAMKNMRPEHFELIDFEVEAREVLGIGKEKADQR